MVIKNYATQDAKIEKNYSEVRLKGGNRYAIDSQNQHSRRENIRISGIVEEEDEVLLDKLSSICSVMGVNVNNADIISCHRVGNKGRPNIPRTVIVRCTRDFKSKVFTNKKTLHGKPEFRMIYFNEDLTTLRFKLLQFVKKLDKVKVAHTRDGKIHSLLMDNTRVAIENPDDLFKLGVNSVDYNMLGLKELE